MSNYRLLIEFKPGDVAKLNEGHFKVALVKGIHNRKMDPKPLWAVFKPFEGNVVTWNDEYGVYASPDPITNETVISASSVQYPARPGSVYPFFDDNTFGPPEGAVQPGDYAVQNNAGEMLTFGLLQGVAVNGAKSDVSPVDAVAAKTGQVVTFQPTETISVFLYCLDSSNPVVTIHEEGKVLVLDMASNPAQTIHFWHEGSQFVHGPVG